MSEDTLYLRELIKKLCNLETIESQILQEIYDRRDEGKALYNHGTLSATAFTVIDTQASPGHNVKGFTVQNTDDTNNIFIAHNITKQPQLDADIVDTLKANPIFSELEPGEGENTAYNVRCIKSIHLLAVTGTATYKIKLVW